MFSTGDRCLARTIIRSKARSFPGTRIHFLTRFKATVEIYHGPGDSSQQGSEVYSVDLYHGSRTDFLPGAGTDLYQVQDGSL